MKNLFELGLVAAWLIALFWVSQTVAARYLAGGRKGTILACALVAMFIFGSLLHPTARFAQSEGPPAVAEAMVQAPTVAATLGASVPPPAVTACKTAAQVPAGLSRGALDSMSVERGGKSLGLASGGRVTPDDTLHLHGWLVNDTSTDLADAACAIVDGKIDSKVTTIYHIGRPDVATALGNARLTASGFDIRLRGADLGSGSHTLAAGALTRIGDRVSALPGGLTIDVAPR